MNLRVIGAGLPRTGTSSLRQALELLLGGPCHHMSAIPGHPFTLGEDWDRALAGENPGWNPILDGYVAAVDWPASMFWRELTAAHPDTLVLLSLRDSAQTWQERFFATSLPYAHMSLEPGWTAGHGLANLMKRFLGPGPWTDPARFQAAYEQHNAEVRAAIPAERLLEWRASEGWAPLCRALDVPVPEVVFPWTNRREEWG